MAIALAATVLSPKWNATLAMISMAPSAPALVVACMRVGRSGSLRTPMEARTMNAAPRINRKETSSSLILNPSTFDKPGETNSRQKGCQRNHNGHVQKAGDACFYRMNAHVANHN
eukprot:CAMPEP_0181262244 /NCGR_PEP_ID=MMETSP1097-20121128/1927_1 /TAXON_ID=35684 /ORGANISM="Pseudopedinella elastica, Strain CCMP716" /LENGTH=114 /DNA_ID=CAMNT_0023360919 /DNA_START=424 /DNA_END=768 /DNA_ORIENTATION=+